MLKALIGPFITESKYDKQCYVCMANTLLEQTDSDEICDHSY